MQAESRICCGFQEMILSFQMNLLMQEDVFRFLFAETGWKIDSGVYDSDYKGSGNFFRNINIVPYLCGGFQFFFQPHHCSYAIEGHNQNSCLPYSGGGFEYKCCFAEIRGSGGRIGILTVVSFTAF